MSVCTCDTVCMRFNSVNNCCGRFTDSKMLQSIIITIDLEIETAKNGARDSRT